MAKNDVNTIETLDKTQKWWKVCWWSSIIILVLASALQHFLYDWTKCPFIGIWSPTGESIAEHDKLMFYPILMWWIIIYFAFYKKKGLDAIRWFTATGIVATTALSLMTVFYFTFFLGFAWPQYLPLHIMFEIISFILAQLLGIHLYRHIPAKKWVLALSLLQATVVIILMAVFTFYPPNCPAFEIVPY